MILPLISEEITASLYEQFTHEQYNANLYLFIAGFLKNKGLNNLSAHFEKQNEEEISHAKMIYSFLTDLGIDVKIQEVPSIEIEITGILSIAEAYLKREIFTTECLDSIKLLAIEEKNGVVEEFLRKMVWQQANEYEEAIDFLDKSKMTGDDWKFVMLWDLSIK